MNVFSVVAIVNIGILLCIAICTLGVAYINHTADGLWSMICLCFWMSAQRTKNDDENKINDEKKIND